MHSRTYICIMYSCTCNIMYILIEESNRSIFLHVYQARTNYIICIIINPTSHVIPLTLIRYYVTAPWPISAYEGMKFTNTEHKMKNVKCFSYVMLCMYSICIKACINNHKKKTRHQLSLFYSPYFFILHVLKLVNSILHVYSFYVFLILSMYQYVYHEF